MSQAATDSNAVALFEDVDTRVTASTHDVDGVSALCAMAMAYADQNDENAEWVNNLISTLHLARQQLTRISASLDAACISLHHGKRAVGIEESGIPAAAERENATETA